MMRLTTLVLFGALSVFAVGCSTEDTSGTTVHKGASGTHDGEDTNGGGAEGTTTTPTGTPGNGDVAKPVTPADGPMTNTTTPDNTTKTAIQAKPIPCTTDQDSVTQSYRVALQRDPDPGGLQNWVGVIQSGDTRLGVLHHIIASQEFLDVHANLTDDEFVSFLYHSFLNRDPDAGGRQGWLNALAGGMSRAAVATAFADSDEFKSPSANRATACYF